MKILCIYNPQAGGGTAAKQLTYVQSLFDKYKIDYDLEMSQHPHHATEIIKDTNLSHYDALIAAGGDGTFYDVLNGYMQHPNRKSIPLGIIPVGTGNSLSRDVSKHIENLESFVRIIAGNNTIDLDIGKATTTDKEIYFANILGFGFSTDVTLTASKYKFFGKMAYHIGVLINTIRLKSYKLNMIVDGKQHKVDNTFVTISNSKYAGSGYLMAPKASISDGKLDVIIVDKIKRLELLQTFAKIFDGSYIQNKHVTYLQASKMRFEAENEKIVSPDGEICGSLPVDIECITGRVKLLAE